MENITCPNCSTFYHGNYCNNCGQKTIHDRFTVRSLISDFFLSALHVEKKGLPYTIRELTLRPGLAIKRVMEGQRLSLYPPFKYLVLVGTIVIIFSLRYKFFHNEITESHSDDLSVSTLAIVMSNQEFFDGFFHFAEDSATLLNIIAIPIFALFSWLLFYRRGFNYAENIILNTFITAQQLLFLLALVPILEWWPSSRHLVTTAYTIGTFGYNVWAYTDFFGGTRVKTIALSVFAIALSYFYQLPANLATYFVLEEYIIPHLHWVPEGIDRVLIN